MKTAQLPPVRVDPSVRAEIEAALRSGESLSEFIEAAALEAARRRKAQQAFLARGRAALVRVTNGEPVRPLQDALDDLEARLKRRLAERLQR